MMKWKELLDCIEKNIDSLACFADDPVNLGLVEKMIKNLWDSLSPVQKAKRMLYWTIEDMVENAELPEVGYARINDDDELYITLSDWTPEDIQEIYGYEPNESIAETIQEVLNEFWEFNQLQPHDMVVAMNYIDESNEWKVDLLTKEEISQFHH